MKNIACIKSTAVSRLQACNNTQHVQKATLHDVSSLANILHCILVNNVFFKTSISTFYMYLRNSFLALL